MFRSTTTSFRRCFATAASTTAPRKRVTLASLQQKRAENVPISVLTAYDHCMAEAMDDAVDIILVGDSVGMVVLGHRSTVPVTLNDIIHHSAAVARGSSRALLVADLPFGSYGTPSSAISSAVRLIQEGNMHSVKVEGGVSQSKKVEAIAREGVPVMGHIGLLPQTAPLAGGYALKGKTALAAMQFVDDALAVEEAGAFSVVLEMVPSQLASFITTLLNIHTIGIGAGPHCSGQVLVAHDMLGMYPRNVPKFVRKYADLASPMRNAFANYAEDVHKRRFPADAVASSGSSSSSAEARGAAAANTASNRQSTAAGYLGGAADAPSTSSSSSARNYYEMAEADLAEFTRLAQHRFGAGHRALSALTATADELVKKSGVQIASTAGVSSSARIVVKDDRPASRSAAPSPSQSSPSTSPSPSQSGLKVAIVGSGAVASLAAAALSHNPSISSLAMASHWSSRLSDIKSNGIVWRQNIAGEGASGPGSTLLSSPTHLIDLQQASTMFRAIRERTMNAGTASRCAPKRDADLSIPSSLIEHVGCYDAVLLCGKAHQVDAQAIAAALLVKPLTGAVLPLYNGAFSFEYLRACFGGLFSRAVEGGDGADAGVAAIAQLRGLTPQQVAYGQTSFGARFVEQDAEDDSGQAMGKKSTIVEHTGHGMLHYCLPITDAASSSASPSPVLSTLSSVFATGPADGAGSWIVRAKQSTPEDFETLRWTKLAVNSVLNPVVGLLGVANGGLLEASRGPLRHRVAALAEEAAAAARISTTKKGISTPSLDWTGRDVLEVVERVSSATASNTNSMLVDLRGGRFTEAPFINGAVVKALQGQGQAAPANTSVLEAVKARLGALGMEGQDIAEGNAAGIIEVAGKWRGGRRV